MRDILPTLLLERLRDRYLAGVADAEAAFDQHMADEDSLTGALGQALAMRDPIIISGPNGAYAVQISYKKLRGRGPGAPEKKLGADGVFQIEVKNDHGSVVLNKGLPFQAKTNWQGRNADLVRQAKLMEKVAPGGLVIDYSSLGYKACAAEAVVAAEGHRNLVDKSGDMHSLGQLLSRDFLECSIGTRGLYVDPDTDLYAHRPELDGLDLITTQITKLDWHVV